MCVGGGCVCVCVCVILFQHEFILRRLSFKIVFQSKLHILPFSYRVTYKNKYILHIGLLLRQIVKKAIFQIIFTVIPTCHDYIMICCKNNKLCLNLKSIILKLHFIWRFFLDTIIILHIKTPWIKQYCYISSRPFSPYLMILVQATIDRYYVCNLQGLKAFQGAVLHDTHFQSSNIPQFCVQSYWRCIHRLHPYHL